MSRQFPDDPVERVIYHALVAAGVDFTADCPERTSGLDFKLTDSSVHIECKRFATDRTAEQMARVEDVIVIQGMEAARTFARLVTRKQRKYSLDEIDCMRRAISSDLRTRFFSAKISAADVEAHLRTHMINGTDPEEIEREAEAAQEESAKMVGVEESAIIRLVEAGVVRSLAPIRAGAFVLPKETEMMTAEAALRQTDRKHYDAAIAKIEDAIKTAKAEGRRFVEVDLTIEENTGWRGEIREHWRNLGYELGTHVDELFSNSSIKAGRLTLQW